MYTRLIAFAVITLSAVAIMLTGSTAEVASAQEKASSEAATSAIIISSTGSAPNGNYSQADGRFFRVVAGTPLPTPTPGPTPCEPTPATPAGTIYLGNYTLTNGENGTFILNVASATNAADASGAPDEVPNFPVVVEEGAATVTAQVNTSNGMGNGTISLRSNSTQISGTIIFFTKFAYEATPGQTCSGGTATPTPTITPTPNPSPTPIASPSPTQTPIASPSPTPSESTVTVSGRVTTPTGQGLRNAIVTLTDAGGNRRTATTSSFGNFNFASVRSNEAFVVSVGSKRYRFAPKNVSTQTNVSNIDLVGLE